MKKQYDLVLIENNKSQATCIIPKKQLEEPVLNEINDSDRYRPLPKNDIEKVKTSVNKELAILRRDNLISKEYLNSLKQITPTTPSARPTLKAHKDPLKTRLIINTRGSAFYKIAKAVSQHLRPLTTSGKSYIKDSEQLIAKIKPEKLENNERLISFDIAEMYPSLPKADVIQEVIRRIKNDDFNPKINKEALIKLAKLSLNYMTFTINGKFYEQAEGLFIGSPSSPCFAEIFIQRVEELHIYNMINAPRIWLRKVDDTFTISSHPIDETLKELNNIHSKINFTAEEETNNTLPFLDCLLTRAVDGNIKTSVYKKATHTGQYINYYSNQPKSVKTSVIKTLTKRAKLLCSEKDDLEKELQYITTTMELNDFPRNLVKKTIGNTLNAMEKRTKENTIENEPIPLFLPYEKGISEEIAKMSKKYNVRIVHTKNLSLVNKIRKKQQEPNILDTDGVIYRVPCSECDKVYIGETGRQLKIRLKEHKANAKSNNIKNMSGLSQHIKNEKHEINWDDAEILDRDNNYQRRKFKEAVAINKNKENILNKKEEIKTISYIWDDII